MHPGKIKGKRALVSLYIIILATFITHTPLSGSQKESPRIGLVLSGGGAKGMAHIGILKALEKAGITPDYITGTSMGSIMGGLYASGYTADEIKSIALAADWDQLLSNKIKLNEVVYDEKDYYGRYLYEININGLKPELPKGLIEGQKLMTLLTNLTRPVMDIDDFSKLPIPFACIGANIENGEKVVLNKGSLARSMRASMAIPSVFTPVTIDNKLLVDGGLVHNFPVEENIEMGADYIIGVFVGTNLLTKDQIGSPVSVLTQSAFIMGSYDTEKQKKLVDMYIEPDMTLFGSGDFHKAADIIAMGEKYGEMFLEKFINLNDSLGRLGRVNRKVSRPPVSDSVAVAAVSIRNNSLVADDFIAGRLGLEDIDKISVSSLEKNITGLYGTGMFTKILYEIRETENGNELIIDVTETPQGKIRTALQYDTETRMSVLLNLTYRNLLLNDSRFVFEGEISENPLADLNYIKYFGKTHNFGLTGGYYFRKIEVPDFEDEQIEGIFNYNFSRFYASLHSSHRTNRLLKLAYSWEAAGLIPQVGIDDILEIEKLNYGRHNIEASFGFNDMNERYFPTKGNELSISLKYAARGKSSGVLILPDSINPTRIETDTEAALIAAISHKILIPLGKRMSFGMENSLWLNPLGDDENPSTSKGFLTRSFIGGFRALVPNARPFMGSEPLRYYADNLFYNELKIQYEVKRKLFLQLNTQYYNAVYPMGFIFPWFEDQDYYFGGKNFLFCAGATAGYLSPVGPISLSAAKGNTGAGWQFFLNIGYYLDRK